MNLCVGHGYLDTRAYGRMISPLYARKAGLWVQYRLAEAPDPVSRPCAT
jgi:hypothetical protein